MTIPVVPRPVLVLLLTAVLLGLPGAPAQGRAPDAEVGTRQVAAWQHRELTSAGLSPAGRAWSISEAQPAGDAVLVGAEWTGEVDAEIRARHGGRWGPWEALERDADEHGPDPSTHEGRQQRPDVSAPVWIGRSDAIQVRTSGAPPRDLRLHTVSLSGGDGVDYLPPELRDAGAAHAAAATPTIVPRSSWDPKGQCKPRGPASYANDVRFTYVHHTVTSNSYSASQGPGQALAVCLYHRNSRGWDDVGYNFLIDRYGAAYEGRAGGTTEAVIGAQAAGFNAGSSGISLLGTFTSTDPPLAMIDTLADLLAWKMDVHHIDPRGTTVERSGGGGTNRHAYGEVVTLPTLMGHRDTGLTSCPGDRVYQFVSSGKLRDMVLSRMGHAIYGGPPARVEQPVIGDRQRFQASFTSPSDWRLTIQAPTGQVVRSTGGRGASGVDLRWDGRDDAGTEVSPGAYTATLETIGGSARPVQTALRVTPATERAAGADRVETSVRLSRWAFNDPRLDAAGMAQSERVVIASADAFPDALVATPLAASYDAPVMLTRKPRLPSIVADEIRRLKAHTAYVIGGPARISAQVEADLKAAGVRTVERLAGADRYATAGKVAWRVVERESPKEALVAIGNHADQTRAFQDALVAGAFGGEFELPVLLVKPTDVTAPTKWVLEQRDWIRGVTVVGGRDTISSNVKSALGNYAGASVKQFAGSDAYGTSQIMAEQQLKRWSERPKDPQATSKGLEVVVATGENWPDALGAGAAAVERGAAFLLVHASDLRSSQPAADWFTAHAASTVHVVAAGGPMAIAEPVLVEIERIIRSKGPHTAPREQWPADPYAPGGIALPAP